MEVPELLALKLVAHRRGDLGGLDGARPEDREILQDDFRSGSSFISLAMSGSAPLQKWQL